MRTYQVGASDLEQSQKEMIVVTYEITCRLPPRSDGAGTLTQIKVP